MARDLEITYGGYTIGGTTTRAPVDRMRVTVAYPTSEFEVEFVVSGVDDATFAAEVQAAESQLRLPRQRLTVRQGNATLLDYDPDPAANTGFNAVPELTKIAGPEDSGRARRYRLALTFQLPATLAGFEGRQEENVELATSLQNRRVVTISGTYTAVPRLGADPPRSAREEYLAKIGLHASAVLAAIDPAAHWSLADETASADDPDKLVTYKRTYWEVVNGRREAQTDVAYDAARRRTVRFTGTYTRTLDGTSPTDNYATYERFHANAVLQALTGFFELTDEDTKVNDIDGSLDFTRTYHELIHEQTPHLYDDPAIVSDSIQLSTTRTAPGDSLPQALSTAGRRVTRLIDVAVRYEAFVDSTHTRDPLSLWNAILRSHLLGFVASRLAVGGGASVVNEHVEVDPVLNKLSADLDLQAADGDIYELSIETETSEESGRVLTPVYGGKPHVYLDQQAPPKLTRTRQVRAVLRDGSSLGLGDLTAKLDDAWVLLRKSEKQRPYRVGLGAYGALLTLVELNATEEWQYVQERVVRGLQTVGRP